MSSVEPNSVKDVTETAEDLFREYNAGIHSPFKLGPGTGNGRAAVPLGLSWGVPLAQWQFRPESADIKIGNFYLDFRTLSASLLYSDNAWRSSHKDKSGFISMVGWSMAAMLQVEEHLRLAVAFSMVYLPFENKIGFFDPTEIFSFSTGPRGMAQISYDLPIGNWDFRFYDTFGVYTPGYLWGGAFDLFETDFDGEDRVGRYAYRIVDRNTREHIFESNRLFDHYTFGNVVGANTSHLLPTSTRFSAGAAHHDVWSSGLPNDVPRSSEMVYAGLDNEHDNMRFKPFFHYTGTHAEGQDGWNHTVRGGFRGPISDYLSLLTDAGYFWTDASEKSSLLWNLRLDHDINSTTSQSFRFARTTTFPLQSIQTTVGYMLRKTFGPDLRAEAVAERSQYEPVDKNAPDFIEYQAGIRALYNMTPRLSIRSGVYYRYIDPGADELDALTVRSEAFLRLAATVDAVLMHQYTRLVVGAGNDGWGENLMILTVRKTF